MIFFHKKHTEERSESSETISQVRTRPITQEGTPKAAEPHNIPTREEQDVTSAGTTLAMQDAARQWWQERYGEPMPEAVVRWLKQLTRTEARRIATSSALLTPQRMSRLEEARRLATTKLRNTEQSLQRVHDQLEWLGRYKEKMHELEEHRNRLYEVNKQLASLTREEQELERFEAFENAQGRFQRTNLLTRMATQNKEERTRVASRLSTSSHLATDEGRRLEQLHDDTEESLRRVGQMRDELEEANRTLGARQVLDITDKSEEELAAAITERRDAILGHCHEQEEEAERLSAEITQLRTERQALEPHLRTAEHGEALLAELDRLQEMKEDLEQLAQTQKESLRRQQEENEMLGRVFADYQAVESDIRALNDEIHLHRQQNLGRSSYSLQERAMQLKSRRQMLLSAQSLWNRISSGYLLIEEKTQRVNQLRLTTEHLRQQIEELRTKLEPMRKLAKEKEYTLTLSKSQNVIELRGDLKEGTPCTVCGASHHPYHSDTMLEQSKLISDLRTDYELLQNEHTAKEVQLRELEDVLVAEQTRYDVERDALSQLRHRQMEDVKEWGVFCTLDRSFQECSSSTNLEARTALLRQLIEQTARDADEAQRELDEYNFHQTRLNETSEQLTQKELQKSDLITRLNEVNTGCQVMAGRVERLQQTRTELQERYTQLYEKLGAAITLNDWYADWQTSHEGLRLRIEQIMAQWKRLSESITDKERHYERLQTALEEKHAAMAFLETLQLRFRDECERRNTLRKEGEQTLERVLGSTSVKTYWDTYYQAFVEAKLAEDRQREKASLAKEEVIRNESEMQLLTLQGDNLDRQASEERSGLDVWMRQFNANHPPVQYNELERVFGADKDWGEVRNKVRSTRISAMLEQSRVDQLRSAIVALQAEGHQSPTRGEDGELLESLVAQQKQLEKQRQEVLMQIAEQELTLRAHEECKARMKTEEDELYAKLSVSP